MASCVRRVGRLIGGVAVVAAAMCKPQPDRVVLQREWTANAEFAGDVLATHIAQQSGMTLDVREGSEAIDPVKTVRSGAAHFGVASADRVLQENEGGAGLIVVAAATYRSPVVFLTQKSLGITTPVQFAGRTIGLQSGTNTELVFHALAKAAGVPVAELKIVDSGWGTQTFEVGSIDVLGAFAYDEPVALQMKGIEFLTIWPEDYGVRYVGTVYFTRKELIDSRPDLVQQFLIALVGGWKKALAEPRQAIDDVAERFETVRSNVEKERRSFEKGRDFFAGEDGRLLYASKARWTAMAESLIALGKLKSFDFSNTVDYRFLEKASE